MIGDTGRSIHKPVERRALKSHAHQTSRPRANRARSTLARHPWRCRTAAKRNVAPSDSLPKPRPSPVEFSGPVDNSRLSPFGGRPRPARQENACDRHRGVI
jgi:hypothetical protein